MAETPVEPSETVTYAQAAALLGVDPARIRQWVSKGDLQPVPGATPMRVTLLSVNVLRDKRASKPAAPQAVSAKARGNELVAELLTRIDDLQRRAETLAIEAGQQRATAESLERMQAERDQYLSQLRDAEQRAAAAEAALAAKARRRWGRSR